MCGCVCVNVFSSLCAFVGVCKLFLFVCFLYLFVCVCVYVYFGVLVIVCLFECLCFYVLVWFSVCSICLSDFIFF